MNETIYRFEAVLQKVPDLNGAYVEFPYDVRAEFGKGRVKVHATFDGQPYDGSLGRMGTPGTSSACAETSARRSESSPATWFPSLYRNGNDPFFIVFKGGRRNEKEPLSLPPFPLCSCGILPLRGPFVRLLRPGQRCSCLRT